MADWMEKAAQGRKTPAAKASKEKGKTRSAENARRVAIREGAAKKLYSK